MNVALRRHRYLSLGVLWLFWFGFAWYILIVGSDAIFASKERAFVLCGGLTILIASVLIRGRVMQFDGMMKRYIEQDAYWNDEVDYYLKETIGRKLRPLVTLLVERDDIAARAASLVRGAASGRDVAGYRLVFFGAVGFQVSAADDGAEFMDDRVSPHQIYHGALEEMSSRELSVARFVRLLRIEEFKTRSPSVQRRYREWLESQLGQMKRNPNFVIIDCPRAPQWGSAGGMIVSSGAVLQFTHGLGPAIFIEDDRIALGVIESNSREMVRSVRRNIRIFRKMTGHVQEMALKNWEVSDATHPESDESQYDFSNIVEFEKFIKSIKDAFEEEDGATT